MGVNSTVVNNAGITLNCFVGAGCRDAQGYRGMECLSIQDEGTEELRGVVSLWPFNGEMRSDLIECKPTRVGRGCFLAGHGVICPGLIIGRT